MMYCNALYCTALNCFTHCTALHCTALYCTALTKQTNKQEVYYRSYSITMGQGKAKFDQHNLKLKIYVFSYSALLSSRCIQGTVEFLRRSVLACITSYLSGLLKFILHCTALGCYIVYFNTLYYAELHCLLRLLKNNQYQSISRQFKSFDKGLFYKCIYPTKPSNYSLL